MGSGSTGIERRRRRPVHYKETHWQGFFPGQSNQLTRLASVNTIRPALPDCIHRMRHLTFLSAVLWTACALAQNRIITNPDLRGTVDSTNATLSKPFRAVTSDPTGSCGSNGDVVMNSSTGARTACIAGTWLAQGGSGGGGGLTLSGNGIAVQTGIGTSAARTLQAVAGQTVITNPDGVSGNPTIGVYPNPTGQMIPFGFILGADDGSALVDTNDQATIFANQLGIPLHVKKIWCETDQGTATINLHKSGSGGGSNIAASNL